MTPHSPTLFLVSWGRFVTMTENHVACDYPRAPVLRREEGVTEEEQIQWTFSLLSSLANVVPSVNEPTRRAPDSFINGGKLAWRFRETAQA